MIWEILMKVRGILFASASQTQPGGVVAAKGNLVEKRKIQKMVFPDGIEYDHKNDEYRTFRVNSFFSYIPVVSKELGHKKTGKFRVKTKNSGLLLL